MCLDNRAPFHGWQCFNSDRIPCFSDRKVWIYKSALLVNKIGGDECTGEVKCFPDLTCTAGFEKVYNRI